MVPRAKKRPQLAVSWGRLEVTALVSSPRFKNKSTGRCTVLPSSTLHAGEGMIALGAATMARDRSDPSYST